MTDNRLLTYRDRVQTILTILMILVGIANVYGVAVFVVECLPTESFGTIALISGVPLPMIAYAYFSVIDSYFHYGRRTLKDKWLSRFFRGMWPLLPALLNCYSFVCLTLFLILNLLISGHFPNFWLLLSLLCALAMVVFQAFQEISQLNRNAREHLQKVS